MATIYSTGLLILRVPLWAGIGFIAGVIGIIPYLGVTSGLLLAVGFATLDGAGIGRLAGVLIVFAIAQMTEDYVLTPRIIGGKLSLHPMLVFIALIVAGDFYGLLGLVLAIPALAVLKVFVRFFDELYLRSDFYLAPAVSSSGQVEDHSTMQRAVTATTVAEEESFRRDDGILGFSGALKENRS
jgi:predicted PurR-regulated permease PerM